LQELVDDCHHGSACGSPVFTLVNCKAVCKGISRRV
jgi:hypothetical protein